MNMSSTLNKVQTNKQTNKQYIEFGVPLPGMQTEDECWQSQFGQVTFFFSP